MPPIEPNFCFHSGGVRPPGLLRRLPVALVVFCALMQSGCPRRGGLWDNAAWPQASAGQNAGGEEAKTPATAANSASAGAAATSASAADTPSTESGEATPSASFRRWGYLASGPAAWLRNAQQEPMSDAAGRFRWSYLELERAAAEEPPALPDLKAALRQSDPVVAANAAIVLARRGDRAGFAVLERAVQTHDLPLAQRCAAVEALAFAGGDSALAVVRRLADRYAGFDRRDAAYVPDLHAELLHALAACGAVDDPRYAKALHSPKAEVRIAALRALAHGPPGALPPEALEMARSPDPASRRAALHAAAARRVPQAATLLEGALGDIDLSVRLTAIAGLGVLGGEAALPRLRAAMQERGERVRLEALRALARLGDESAVWEARRDKAWQVRFVVAESLEKFPGPKAAEAARELLDDRSSAVQMRVITAVGTWPIDQAASILWEAMGKSTHLPPETAARLLARHWPPAREFLTLSQTAERRTFLASRQADFDARFGPGVRQIPATVPTAAPAAIDPQRLAVLANLLQQASEGDAARQDAALAQIQRFGPELPEALAQASLDRNRPLPNAVWREVLPGVHEAFAETLRLSESDRTVRRRATERLAALSRQGPLPRLAAARICALVTRDEDALVWHGAMEALAQDNGPHAVQLAYAGAGHASPEVRRMACAHLAAHPSPKHVGVLVPSLDDASPAVVYAAVQALGACGPLDDPAPLVRLLGSPNERLRVAAAGVLAGQKVPAGVTALERLAMSRDSTVRRETALAMGGVGLPEFAAALVRLLDDQVSVQTAALENLPRVVGRDLPGELRGRQERIDAWKAWARAGMRGEPGTAPRTSVGAPVAQPRIPQPGPVRAADADRREVR